MIRRCKKRSAKTPFFPKSRPAVKFPLVIFTSRSGPGGLDQNIKPSFAQKEIFKDFIDLFWDS